MNTILPEIEGGTCMQDEMIMIVRCHSAGRSDWFRQELPSVFPVSVAVTRGGKYSNNVTTSDMLSCCRLACRIGYRPLACLPLM